MAVDFGKPTPTTARADNLTYTVDNVVACAKQLDDTTPTGVATGMIRWSSTNSKWQKYNGTTWADLASTYSINVSTFGGQAASYYTDIAARLGYTPVNKAGDTMTGYLTLNGAPTSSLHAATKKYVDDLSATSGTWTPTLSAVSGCSGLTAYSCIYLRVGNTVTFSGVLDATVSAANPVIGITLPVASGFTGVTDLSGVGTVANATAGFACKLYADATNDRITLTGYFSVTGVAYSIYFHGSYRVI
jgi:hypothetical protein